MTYATLRLLVTVVSLTAFVIAFLVLIVFLYAMTDIPLTPPAS